MYRKKLSPVIFRIRVTMTRNKFLQALPKLLCTLFKASNKSYVFIYVNICSNTSHAFPETYIISIYFFS